MGPINYDRLREWANGYREAEGEDQHRRSLVCSLLAEIERLRSPSNRDDDPKVTVPKRWVDEVLLALAVATHISNRGLRTGRPEGLATANHDRLIEEAHDNGWSNYG